MISIFLDILTLSALFRVRFFLKKELRVCPKTVQCGNYYKN
ncbi:hypothetical protein LEP1GSC082_1013 [Leptospira kirschneri str. H2]|uniref:Uncharacterized protein n=1 Tax=Leptospira kirschneri str. H1 TaxID=1049966 RepID=A0A0E2BKA0_9LEPT|nr:hypothetical protein LEP1GSC081_0742 [Leptospira kirschneri str. H1]EKO60395.1 hypothetical protein LEP1GSC082_1013 [Leptospira kirschneri str. H2]